MSKIIGVTVGTPTSPAKIEQDLKPVKTVNGVAPGENGNVNVRDSIHALYVTHNDEGVFTCESSYREVREAIVNEKLTVGIFTNTDSGITEQLHAELHDEDGEIWFYGANGAYIFYASGGWEYDPNASGGSGEAGKDGVTFTPSVSASGVLSWTNDGGLKNPSSVNIKGEDGEDGADGYSVLTMNVIGANYRNVSYDRFSTAPKVGDLAITNDGYLYKVVSSMFETMTYGVELVANLNGATGPQGDPGPAGAAGAAGDTPYIGANGNWWIGEEDTGVSASGGGGSSGGGKTWTLLNEVTLEADAALFITQDAEGKALDEQRLFVLIYAAVNSAGNKDAHFVARNKNGGNAEICGWGTLSGPDAYYHIHDITALGEYVTDYVSTKQSAIGPRTSNTLTLRVVDFSGNIFGVGSSGNVLPAGSWMKVYGLR